MIVWLLVKMQDTEMVDVEAFQAREDAMKAGSVWLARHAETDGIVEYGPYGTSLIGEWVSDDDSILDSMYTVRVRPTIVSPRESEE